MEKVKLTVKDHSRLTEHRMGYYSGFEDEESEPHFIFPARIMITFFGREGSVVIYRVRMGYFDLEILLCNIQGNAYDKQTNVGKGSFGHVRT